jgi:formylmethanofuran dehydrogenase subunit E
VSSRGIIAAEKPQQCDLCGEISELRPYGPNGEMVCFPCGSKDEGAMERGFRRLVLGES